MLCTHELQTMSILTKHERKDGIVGTMKRENKEKEAGKKREREPCDNNLIGHKKN